MTAHELRQLYGRCSPAKQLSILSWLAHEVTVIARMFYSDNGPQGRAAERDVMIALNELQHQLTAQAGHLADLDGLR